MFQCLPYDIQLEILHWLFGNSMKTIQLFTDDYRGTFTRKVGDLKHIVVYNHVFINHKIQGPCWQRNIVSIIKYV